MTDRHDPTKGERIGHDDEMRFDMRIKFPTPPEMIPFFDPPLPTADHQHGPIADKAGDIVDPVESDLAFDKDLIRGDAGDMQTFLLAHPVFPLAHQHPLRRDIRIDQTLPEPLFRPFRPRDSVLTGRFIQSEIDAQREDRIARDTTIRHDTTIRVQGPERYPPPFPFLRPAADAAQRTFMEKVRDWLAARGLIMVNPAPEDDDDAT